MGSVILAPVFERLSQRQRSVSAEAERLAAGQWPGPIEALLRSLAEELDTLRSLEAAVESSEALARTLGLQHSSLHRHAGALAEVLTALEGRAGEEPGRDVSARLLLADFAQELCDHLDFEEQNECLELAAEAEPRLSRRVVALREEHGTFRRWARTLTEAALAAAAEERAWAEVWRSFEALCEALRDHEAAEAEVLQEAYLLDIGGRG